MTKPAEKVLATTSELLKICTDSLIGKYGSAPPLAVDKCAARLSGKTVAEALTSVGGVMEGLLGLVGITQN